MAERDVFIKVGEVLTIKNSFLNSAPNQFKRGGVTHFWLASETHSIRWIHFYDANVVPTNSAPYQSDYAISHTNSKFEVKFLTIPLVMLGNDYLFIFFRGLIM